MKWQLPALIILLILAAIYRYPVEIQKLKLEAKDLIDETVREYHAREKKSLAPSAIPAKLDIFSIKLKNKRQMVGVIKEQKGETVIIDMGSGTMEIARRDIETIEALPAAEKDRILKEWGRDTGAQAGKTTENKKIILEKK